MQRRDFLRGAIITIGGVAIAPSLLSACGGSSSSSSGALVVGTPDKPVTLPTVGEAIADGLPEEGGTLEILNWADYVNPEIVANFEKKFGVTVRESIYDNEETAINKLRNGTFKPDLILGLTETALPRLVAAKILQPINKSYITNFDNLLAGLQSPYFDVNSQYTIAYNIYGHGIGFRADRIDQAEIVDGGWGSLWNAKYSGKLAVIDSYRETISLAMFQAGNFDVNTVDAAVIAAAGENLVRLRDLTNPKVDIVSYQEIPEGRRDISFMWTGDILTALQYLPEGVSPNILGYHYPKENIVTCDFFCITTESAKPVLAHRFIDYLTSPEGAVLNQAYVGYQPAVSSFSSQQAIADGIIPESLKDCLLDETRYAEGNRVLPMKPDDDALWLNVWEKFTAG